MSMARRLAVALFEVLPSGAMALVRVVGETRWTLPADQHHFDRSRSGNDFLSLSGGWAQEPDSTFPHNPIGLIPSAHHGTVWWRGTDGRVFRIEADGEGYEELVVGEGLNVQALLLMPREGLLVAGAREGASGPVTREFQSLDGGDTWTERAVSSAIADGLVQRVFPLYARPPAPEVFED